jgi:hypothetical protein
MELAHDRQSLLPVRRSITLDLATAAVLFAFSTTQAPRE